MDSKTFFIQGCSHCSGAELPGDTGHGLVYDKSWPNKVATNLNAGEIVNRASPGSSNDWIIEDTINYVLDNKDKDIFVLLGFTGSDRIYLKHLAYQNSKPYGRAILTPGIIDDKKFQNENLLTEHHDMYKSLLQTDWGTWHQIQLRFFRQVNYIQTFLQDNKIPHLFVTTIFPLDARYKKFGEFKWLYDKMDKKNLYGDFSKDTCYYELLKDTFKVNELFHIGQEGQDHFANLITEYIKTNDLLH